MRRFQKTIRKPAIIYPKALIPKRLDDCTSMNSPSKKAVNKLTVSGKYKIQKTSTIKTKSGRSGLLRKGVIFKMKAMNRDRKIPR
jgi:hypothetical protein